MAAQRSLSNTLLMIVVILLVAGGVYYFLYGKDTRSGGQRIGDAVDSLTETHSLKSAGDQLKDSSPAEKLSNKISDKAKQADK